MRDESAGGSGRSPPRLLDEQDQKIPQGFDQAAESLIDFIRFLFALLHRCLLFCGEAA